MKVNFVVVALYIRIRSFGDQLRLVNVIEYVILTFNVYYTCISFIIQAKIIDCLLPVTL